MDKRIIKTKEKLQNALAELSSIKPFNEISISELCKNANTNRNTFYTYYSNTRDLLEDIVKSYEAKIVDAINHSFIKRNYNELIIKICKYIKETISLQKFISCPYFRNNCLNNIMENCSKHSLSVLKKLNPNANEEVLTRKLRFIVGGFTILLLDWFYAGMKEDPSIIIEQVKSISNSLVDNNLHI